MIDTSPIPSRKISQHRIASDLNLSQALVSMVLSGRKERVSEDSYRRIWEHALNLGYRPKGMRAPRITDSLGFKQVGFILRAGVALHTQNNYFSHIQHGMHEALLKRQIGTTFLGTESQLNDPVLRATLESRKDLLGIVIMGQVDPLFLRYIRHVCPRVVSVSISYPGQCHSVQSNENQSLDLLVQHLSNLGHTRFAWIGGNRILTRHEDRYRAFCLAMRAHQLEFDDKNWALVVEGADRIEGGEAAEMFLARPGPRPTAIICYNALMARGAINFLSKNGVKVPSDVSIAAVDATPVCTGEHPFITGASADPAEIGQRAAKLIDDEESAVGENYLDIVLASRLTVRSTTVPPPIVP
jgi:LacI family transcriptional regulator